MSLVVPFEEIFAQEEGLLARHSSWERVELGAVATILNGAAFKSNLFTKEAGFPLIRIRDIANGKSDTRYTGEYLQEHVVTRGDILIGMDGNFECHKWSGEPGLLNQRVCKITANPKYLDGQFLFYTLSGYLKAIQDATSSVTVGHLSSLDVLRIPFPLPPLAEQQRIVAKLKQALERVASCRARLDRVPRLLKRFRQAVLAAACSGRLTEDWRAQNPDAEPAQILAERMADGSTFEELPASWPVYPLGQLSELVTKGSSPNWQGINYTRAGVLFVTSENVGSCELLLQKRKYLEPKFNELQKCSILKRGDILINIVGASIGRAAIFDLDEVANVNQAVSVVRLRSPPQESASGVRLRELLFFMF